MTLSYRGIAYEKPSLALDMNVSDVKGTYRGQQWHHSYPRPMLQLRPKAPQTYRGVQLVDANLSQAPVGSACPVPVRAIHNVVSNDLDRVHFENIRKSLDKRLMIAQSKGDKSLIELLECEYQQLSAF